MLTGLIDFNRRALKNMEPRQYVASMPPVTTAFRKSSSKTGRFHAELSFVDFLYSLFKWEGVRNKNNIFWKFVWLVLKNCIVIWMSHWDNSAQKTCQINLSTCQIFFVDTFFVCFIKKKTTRKLVINKILSF